jgi:hypothetical protein
MGRKEKDAALKELVKMLAEIAVEDYLREEENKRMGVTTMERVTLKWHGPYSFRDLIADQELRDRWNVSGVYLWMDPTRGEETICYVGKTKARGGAPSLFKRQLQHYTDYIGGAYDIPEKMRSTGIYWRLHLNEPGVAETLTNREKVRELAADGFTYANSLKIFLAEADPESVDIIEANLIYSLQPVDNVSGKNRRPAHETKIVHKNAPWATDAVR